MTNEPYNTTQVHFTDLSTFNTCELQYGRKNVERIKKKLKPTETIEDDLEDSLSDEGTVVGTYGHKIFEDGTTFTNAELFDMPDGVKKQIACMTTEHNYFHKKFFAGFITVMHEEEFELKWEDWVFKIKIDKGLIKKDTGKFYVLDYKFYKAAPKFDSVFLQSYQVRGYMWALQKLFECKAHTFEPHKFLLDLLVKRNIKGPHINANGLPSLAETKLISTSFPLIEEWQRRNGGLSELEYAQAMNYLQGQAVNKRYRLMPFRLTTRQSTYFEAELRSILQRIDYAKATNFFMRQPAYHCSFCEYYSLCEDLVETGALDIRQNYYEKKSDYER